MAKRQRAIDLLWPSRGVIRKTAYQTMPPYSAYDADNVRSDANLESRTRGGSRPGMAKTFSDQLGSGNPVRLVDSVRENTGSALRSFRDDFFTNDDWTELDNGTETGPELFSVAEFTGPNDFRAYSASASNTKAESGYITSTPSYQIHDGASTFINYSLESRLYIQYDETKTVEYRFYLRMDDSSPDPYDTGVVAYVRFTGSAPQARMNLSLGVLIYEGGVLQDSQTSTPGDDIAADTAGYFVLTADDDTNKRRYTVEWTPDGGSSASTNLTPTTADMNPTAWNGASSAERIGIGLTTGSTTSADANISCGYVLFNYLIDSGEVDYRRRTIASSNSKLYVEDDSAGLTEIANYDGSGETADLASDRPIFGVEYEGKFYIADWGEPTIEATSGGTVGAVTAGELDDSGVSDWTTYADPGKHAVQLFNHDNSGDGVYAIDAVDADTVEFYAPKPADTTASTGYRIVRCPKYYDVVEDKLYLWTKEVGDGTTGGSAGDLGELPLGCPLIARYQGRIVLAGQKWLPQVAYFSRQGDPLDWNFGASETDPQRAFGTTSVLQGVIGDAITALATWRDDYMVIGLQSGMFLLRGDPLQGGYLTPISESIGMVGQGAFCFTPEAELVFLSERGIYMLGSGQAAPMPISDLVIPAELRNISGATYPFIEYDADEEGIHIFTPSVAGKGSRAAASITNWFLDWRSKSFWPVSFSSGNQPRYARRVYLENTSQHAVLFGCQDGYVRQHDASVATDDGTAFSSYVDIGPIRLGRVANIHGMLLSLDAIVAQSSGDVDYEVYVGNTAEAAMTSTTVVASGTLTSGRNYSKYVWRRGQACRVRLKSSSGSTTAWALEAVTATLEDYGTKVVIS
jgi:hypothetical protein